MYQVMSILGVLIRELYLPNPFTPLGDSAELVNFLCGWILGPTSYGITGMFYESGRNPVAGSLLFTLFYALNTVVVHFAMVFYPNQWIMGGIGVAYLGLLGALSAKIGTAR